MTYKTRIFRVEGGPLAETIKAVTAERERISKMYVALGEVIGCEQVHTWPWTGRFAGCTFAKDKQPSLTGWRKSHRIWVPRKKSSEGDHLWESISKLPPIPAIQTVLEQYGLTVHKPQLDDGPPSYVEGFGDVGVYFVHVPWFEPDPKVVEMIMAIDGSLGRTLTFLSEWQVPIDWVEVSKAEHDFEWLELDR